MQKSKKPQRIVVDTNLWISFLIGRRLGALLELFRNIEYDFVSTQIMRDEIHNVALRPKFRKYFSEDAVKALDNWLVLHTLNFDLDDCNYKLSYLNLVFLRIIAGNNIQYIDAPIQIIKRNVMIGCGVSFIHSFEYSANIGNENLKFRCYWTFYQ